MRAESGTVPTVATAPSCFCAMKVMALPAADNAKKGSFSRVKVQKRTAKFLRPKVEVVNRSNGQRSSRSRRMNGKVTSMGLDIRPSAKRSRDRLYQTWSAEFGVRKRLQIAGDVRCS